MGKIKVLLFILILSTTSAISISHNLLPNNSSNYTTKKTKQSPPRLRVSTVNPHLLETTKGEAVFINNYTVWSLIENGNSEDIVEFIPQCKSSGFNMISTVILSDNYNGSSRYKLPAFATDLSGNPDPTKPATSVGKDPEVAGEYDYWDHVEFVITQAALNNMYISLHPTWGSWVSGEYGGPKEGDKLIFNIKNAYQYGFWLGSRFGKYSNVLWMVGGDRSAVYGKHDFRKVWSAMAEGLADGTNGINNQNGQADYRDILISYHPRKWAANSSEWFHNEPWLAFNSIEDTPYDQIKSLPYDYALKPVKPTWLFEGRYEGATSAWAVRYQAYQTVFAGAFGHTYGNENWQLPENWRKFMDLPGSKQMSFLNYISRKIWSNKQYLNRTPDQSLIIGDTGDTKGDGMTIGDGDGDPNVKHKGNATSDRITAIRDKNGEWAMVYSAYGRNITLNLSKLSSGKKRAYWFNPRTGMWNRAGQSFEKQTPFLKNLKTGVGQHTFDPPGTPGPNNDWVLVIK